MYPIGPLFFYRPIFMTLLLVAEGMFTFRLSRRSHFILRLLFSVVLAIGAAFAFPIPTSNSFYMSFVFLSLWLISFLLMKFCYDEPWRNLFFCAISSYTTEHIAYETYILIGTLFNLSNFMANNLYSVSGQLFSGPLDELSYLESYLVVFLLVFVLFVNKIKGREGIYITSKDLLGLGSLFVLIDILLNSYVNFYASTNYDKTYMAIIAFFNLLCCWISLIFIFVFSYQKQLREDITVLNQLRYEEKKQYQISKENIELINLKCHDLKNQIHHIGNNETISPKTVEQISSLIRIYDTTVKTNNKALDIILTEKSLQCDKKNIKFTCIADGKRLNFMSEEDIYSLFGNIVDNAMEAVEKEDESKRVIDISVKVKGQLLLVSVRNYFSGKLSFSKGLPVSTKGDKRYHGYGMQSIKMIVEKYQGTLTITSKNDMFSLNILFPIQEN